MKITLAHSAGFCYGVRRAVKIAEDLANEGVSAVMLGPIIHNDAEIQRLGALGMETVDDPQEIPQGTAVVLRSHGETIGGGGYDLSQCIPNPSFGAAGRS